ncbi:uncharacterized protein LOC129241735 [Anastrepha obliqua]|uniref:uncharacterized protein LOC129241735 n=1 Tax=Anastrepha obliqua TaxID=95512 RepID=UPI00240A051B|nr:uncharacterized protein LOC129241735 [Anastrepha obliqua]
MNLFLISITIAGIYISKQSSGISVACTEGLCLDKGVVFDHFHLFLEVTPEAIRGSAVKLICVPLPYTFTHPLLQVVARSFNSTSIDVADYYLNMAICCSLYTLNCM